MASPRPIDIGNCSRAVEKKKPAWENRGAEPDDGFTQSLLHQQC